MKRNGWLRKAWATAALTTSGTMWLGSCDQFSKEFRAAAGPQLETGVNALLDGIVTGMFAVVEPDPGSGSSTSPGA